MIMLGLCTHLEKSILKNSVALQWIYGNTGCKLIALFFISISRCCLLTQLLLGVKKAIKTARPVVFIYFHL